MSANSVKRRCSRVLWKGGSLFAMLDALFADTEGSVPVMLCVLLCAVLHRWLRKKGAALFAAL